MSTSEQSVTNLHVRCYCDRNLIDGNLPISDIFEHFIVTRSHLSTYALAPYTTRSSCTMRRPLFLFFFPDCSCIKRESYSVQIAGVVLDEEPNNSCSQHYFPFSRIASENQSTSRSIARTLACQLFEKPFDGSPINYQCQRPFSFPCCVYLSENQVIQVCSVSHAL